MDQVTINQEPDAGNRDIMNAACGLRFISELCHELSVKAGWWNGVDLDIFPDGSSCVTDRDLMASKIALIHSEASEMLEGLRKGLMDKHLPERTQEEVECADLLIRVFDYAEARNLNIVDSVAEKLIYNKTRADHQLENRAKDGGKKF